MLRAKRPSDTVATAKRYAVHSRLSGLARDGDVRRGALGSGTADGRPIEWLERFSLRHGRILQQRSSFGTRPG